MLADPSDLGAVVQPTATASISSFLNLTPDEHALWPSRTERAFGAPPRIAEGVGSAQGEAGAQTNALSCCLIFLQPEGHDNSKSACFGKIVQQSQGPRVPQFLSNVTLITLPNPEF